MTNTAADGEAASPSSSSSPLTSVCSNPYTSGCFHTLLGGGDDDTTDRSSSSSSRSTNTYLPRVCHSQDTQATIDAGLCRLVGSSFAAAATDRSTSSDGTDNESGQSETASVILPDYPEVRLYSNNWESSYLDTWILQALLSELLEVPTTIEIGHDVMDGDDNDNNDDDRIHRIINQSPLDLYSPTRSYYPGSATFNGWQSLYRSSEIGDCRLDDNDDANNDDNDDDGNDNNDKNNNSDNDDYTPCAHVMTEVWAAEVAWNMAIGGDGPGINDDDDDDADITDDDSASTRTGGYIEPPQGLGVLAQEGWYIPQFTARQDPSLTSYWGLIGKREKLANMFLQPTTWGQYCREESPSNCTVADGVAKRPPLTTEEADRYFYQLYTTSGSGSSSSSSVETNLSVNTTTNISAVMDENSSFDEDGDGVVLFTGYFRSTDDNDCELWPDNCTGHIVDYPCGWTSHAVQQAYHLDIPVKGNGNEGKSNGYKDSEMRDIWRASNYTKSHVIMYFWQPDSLFDQYVGSEAEFTKITLPTPTQECVEHRVSVSGGKDLRCYGDTLEERVGDPVGSCDDPPNPLQKVVSKGLYEMIYDPAIPDPLRSPAYEAIQLFTISGLQLDEVFAYWRRYGDPRDAVCHWLVDNEEWARQFIPATYPRDVRPETASSTKSPLSIFTLAFASMTILLVLVTCVAVYLKRNSRVMKYAQIEFVSLILTGLCVTAIGALLVAIPASDGICIATIWMLLLGRTVELLPLLVKISAINRLFLAASNHRRVILKRNRLFGVVFGISIIVCIFLALWTALDPPLQQQEYELTNNQDENGRTTITSTAYCSSDSDVWSFLAVGWNGVMVLAATVLAFQSRKIKLQDFNESAVLGLIAWQKGILLILQVLIQTFLDGNVDDAVLSQCLSIIYSVDTVITLTIYFVPKFLPKHGKSRLAMWYRKSIPNLSHPVGGQHGVVSPSSPSPPPSHAATALSHPSTVDDGRNAHHNTETIPIVSDQATSTLLSHTCSGCNHRWLPSCCPQCGRNVPSAVSGTVARTSNATTLAVGETIPLTTETSMSSGEEVEEEEQWKKENSDNNNKDDNGDRDETDSDHDDDDNEEIVVNIA